MDNKKSKPKYIVKIAHVIFINRLNVRFDKNDTKLSYERKKLIWEVLNVTFKKCCL